MKFRRFLYGWARFLGDVNAVKKNDVGGRLMRRSVGRAFGRLFK